MSKKRTHEEYIGELLIKNPNIKAIEQYTNIHTSIKHYCTKHDVYFYTSPNNVLQGKGCKECGKEKRQATRRKPHDQYVKELKLKNPTIDVIEQYINTNTPILHHCLIHDIIWSTTPARVLRGVGCEECRIEKFRQVRCKTHEQYVKAVATINPDIIVVGEYIDAQTPIDHYCIKHDMLWSPYPDNVLKGMGCKKCGDEKIREKNIKSHNEYIEDVYIINPDIEVIEEYKGANVSILHRCKIDGYVWSAKPANILSGKGCPQCNESNGERQVRQWLEKHNIKYQYQKTFNDCKDVRVLPFDFYLPEYNVCIEYDGEQHFRPVKFDGKDDETAEKQFETTRKHDKMKDLYCIANDILLLRIPYYKNIEEELKKFLFI